MNSSNYVKEALVNTIFQSPFHDLSFDALSALALTDQARFEALRTELIGRAINVLGGNADQLAALQSRLNQHSDSATSRYLSCLQLSEWLDESYQRLTWQLNDTRQQE
jgi:hypothetical protein